MHVTVWFIYYNSSTAIIRLGEKYLCNNFRCFWKLWELSKKVKYPGGIHKTCYTFRRVSQYCILCRICVCVTNLCLLICTYLVTHVAICHWHYSHLVKASTVETVFWKWPITSELARLTYSAGTLNWVLTATTNSKLNFRRRDSQTTRHFSCDH